MKKILSLVLAALMLAAVLCACDNAGSATTDPATAPVEPSESTESNEPTEPGESSGPDESGDITVINVADYLGDASKWEDDGGYFDMDESKIFFDNYAAGDYCAVRLNEEVQNVTYKFSVTISQLAPVSMDDWTWWDSEFLVIARSAQAGSSWQDDGSQVGYTLTSWGDMSTVFIGRCGYDDAFGEFSWNVNDGQPHEIELTVANNDDNTQVTITLVVDGVEVAEVVDDGTKIKEDRPGLYPDAGGLTIRCKWLEATIE